MLEKFYGGGREDTIKDVNYNVGQLTTFNQLGFTGKLDKPDGWYLPNNYQETAVVMEFKATKVSLGDKQINELKKNIEIIQSKYKKVVGILYNGISTKVFKGLEEYISDGTDKLQNIDYYLSIWNDERIDKEKIYELTARINNSLHYDFGIKNLYHRMIFTACALVAKRYGAYMSSGMSYSAFTSEIKSSLNSALQDDKKQNQKIELLLEVFSEIRMNLNVNSSDSKEQESIVKIIGTFIENVKEISDCINSDLWNGEDVMGIFFNEFNRYKKKSENGQIFTPEHITDFIYKLLEVNKDDRILDATCGSGGFLVKAMANMIKESGGEKTDKAKEIKQNQLFGIEFDREIYALACANMLIHKDGKTNLEQMDAKSKIAGEWIKKQNITKVLMNPPYERKYKCMDIVLNVLGNVPKNTMCAFILPDKKIEKASKKHKAELFNNNRLKKIIKLPENLFPASVVTSIFIFESGISQNNKEIFTCYIEDDGLETVKNKGRHDIHGKWKSIEERWLNIIEKQTGDKTIEWINPNEYQSYQMPKKPFELYEEDFIKVAMDYIMFEEKIDEKEFKQNLLDSILYSSEVTTSQGDIVEIKIQKGEKNEKN